MNIHKAETPVFTTDTHGKVPCFSRGARWPQRPGKPQRRRPVRHTEAQTGLAAGRGRRRSLVQRPVGPTCGGTPGRARQGQQGSRTPSYSEAAGLPGSPVWDSHLARLLHSLALSPPASSSQRPVHWQLGPHPAEPDRHLGSR